MEDGRHHEKSKNRHISPTVAPIGMKFGTMMHVDPANPMDSLNFENF